MKPGGVNFKTSTGGGKEDKKGRTYMSGDERQLPRASPTPPTPTEVKARESGEAFRLRLVISLSLCVFP